MCDFGICELWSCCYNEPVTDVNAMIPLLWAFCLYSCQLLFPVIILLSTYFSWCIPFSYFPVSLFLAGEGVLYQWVRGTKSDVVRQQTSWTCQIYNVSSGLKLYSYWCLCWSKWHCLLCYMVPNFFSNLLWSHQSCMSCVVLLTLSTYTKLRGSLLTTSQTNNFMLESMDRGRVVVLEPKNSKHGKDVRW